MKDLTIILGAGLAGLSLANFLERNSVILEKEKRPGGLCRSFEFQGVFHDIGPHILFSKNKKMLGLITSWTKTHRIKRSNKIFLNGRLVKYPFENDLASLRGEDKEYCLKEFLHNPYEHYEPQNMLQFFLKTFGEGITRLYLQSYNEKIWKFDLSFMDTQMVERIPKPPKEDVIRSAKGIETEGYKHQLYFHYPQQGGIEGLIEGLKEKIKSKSRIINAVRIGRIEKKYGAWEIKTDKGTFRSKTLISCIPLHELFRYLQAPREVLKVLGRLKYNSIHVVVIEAKRDRMKDNFALYVPNKDVIFHRLSKINFLGPHYSPKNRHGILLAEITHRPESFLASLSEEEIKGKVLEGLNETGLVRKEDVLKIICQSFKYAYVIYDLNHRKNADVVLNYLKEKGLRCCGRFAEFEYLNMDEVVGRSYNLAQELNLRQR